MTCNKSKPWKNPIFAQLIKTQWWGPKGEGRWLGLDPTMNPYLNAPMSMLALVATAVCGMLCCWKSTDNFHRLNASSLACSLEGQWTSMKTFTGEGEGHCINITEVNSAFRWNLSRIDRFSLGPIRDSKRGVMVLEGGMVLARGTGSCT